MKAGIFAVFTISIVTLHSEQLQEIFLWPSMHICDASMLQRPVFRWTWPQKQVAKAVTSCKLPAGSRDYHTLELNSVRKSKRIKTTPSQRNQSLHRSPFRSSQSFVYWIKSMFTSLSLPKIHSSKWLTFLSTPRTDRRAHGGQENGSTRLAPLRRHDIIPVKTAVKQ